MVLDGYSTVLCIDSCSESQALYRRCLQRNKEAIYQITVADSGADGLILCRQKRPDAILLGYPLADLDGRKFLQELTQQFSQDLIPVILLIGREDEAIGQQAINWGAQDFLSRETLTAELLGRTVRSAIKQAQLQRQIVQQQAEIATLQASKKLLEEDQLGVSETALTDSEKLFRSVFEQAAVGITQVTIGGRVIRSNQCFCDFLGYAPSELVGKSFQNFIHPDDLVTDFKQVQRLLAGEIQSLAIEKRCIRKDGQITWANLTVSLISDQAGRSQYLLAIVEDINARKQLEIDRQHAEEELKTQQQLLRAFLDNLPHIAWFKDRQGRFITANQPFGQTCGVAPADLVGKTDFDIWQPDQSRVYQQDDLEVIQSGQQKRVEEPLLTAEGKIIWIDTIKNPIYGDAGEIVGTVGIAIDITDRKQSEEALRQSEAKQRALLSALPDLIMRINREGVYLDFIATTTFPVISNAEALVGTHVQQTLPPELAAQRMAAIEAALQTGAVQIYEQEITVAGKIQTEEVRVVACGENEALLVVRDISDRKRSEAIRKQREEEIRRSEARLAQAQRIAHIGDWEVDVLAQKITWSEELFRIYGRDPSQLEPRFSEYIQMIHPADRDKFVQTVQQALQTGEPYVVEFRVCRPDGSICVVEGRGEAIRNAEGQVIRLFGTTVDITTRAMAELERQQAAEALLQLNQELETIVEQRTAALKQNEAELSSIFNQAAVGIVQIDASTYQFLKLNQKFCDMLGYTQAELSQNTFIDITHPEDLPACYLLMQQLQAQQLQEFTLEKRYVQKDSTLIWMSTTVSVVRQPDGSPNYYIAIAKDISDRKQAEQALQDSEERLRLALIASNQGLYDLNMKTGHAIVSPEYAMMLGEDPATFQETNANWIERLHPDDREGVAGVYHAYVRGEIPHYKVEFRQRIPNGGWKWILSLGKIVEWDAEGQPLRMMGTHTDISDRKQAEQELRQSEARFRRIFDSDVVGMMFTNFDGHIMDANDRFLQMVGYTRTELKTEQLRWDRMTPPEYRALDLMAIEQLTQTGEIAPFEKEYIRKDGSRIPILVGAAVLENESTQVIVVVVDITDRKQAEAALRQVNAELESRVEQRTAELQKAKEAAEAASRAKSIFLANMSHELRTPLNAILGFSQLLGHSPSLPSTQQEQINIINRSGNHLLGLINDILEMSKIEAGRITFNPNCFDLYDFLHTLEQMFQLRIERKGLQLICHHSADLPQYIKTDERKLRQVLINLLGNAVKFTQAGSVTLKVQRQELNQAPSPSSDRSIHLLFEVTDTGPGIDPDELDSLFEPFVQSKNPSLNQEGTGLGLPISRQFVRLLGGELHLSSVPGQGASFRFEIPVIQVTQAQVITSDPEQRALTLAPQQPLYRILIVEDDWASRELLINLLQPLGFDVKAVVNGREAVNMWQRWHPHCVWMDIRMPGMDGFEATRQLRSREQAIARSNADSAEPPTVIIALTAGVFEEDRDRVIAAGCDDFVPKPLQERVILKKLKEHLGVQFVYEETATQVQQGGNSKPLALQLEVSMLEVMSDEWQSQFYQAVTHLNPKHMLMLVEQIPEENATLAEMLRDKINNFDFEQLMNLLES